MAVLFETPRLLVRHLQPTDVDAYHRIIGDAEVMRYIRPPQTFAGTREFLEKVISRYTPGSLDLRLAVEEKETGLLIGNFAVIPLERTGQTQLGYAFVQAAWGKGYATELTRAGIQYAFEQLGLEELAAIAEQSNLASLQVLLKCGFEQVEVYEDAGKTLCRFILPVHR